MLSKQVLRENIFNSCLNQLERQNFELKITQKAIETIKKYTGNNFCLASYCPLSHEVDPIYIMKFWQELGKSICLPVIDSNTISFFSYQMGDPLIKGKFNILEPEVKINPVIPDIMLVPLVACTLKGERLGHGYGYYDHFMAINQNIIAIGLAFPHQVLDSIPQDQNDIALDHIITVD